MENNEKSEILKKNINFITNLLRKFEENEFENNPFQDLQFTKIVNSKEILNENAVWLSGENRSKIFFNFKLKNLKFNIFFIKNNIFIFILI